MFYGRHAICHDVSTYTYLHDVSLDDSEAGDTDTIYKQTGALRHGCVGVGYGWNWD